MGKRNEPEGSPATRPVAPFGSLSRSESHQVAPGWWQATDDRWYPPELHPRYLELQAEVARDVSAHPDASAPSRGAGGSLLGIGGLPSGVSLPNDSRFFGRFTAIRLVAVAVVLLAAMVRSLWNGDDPTGETTAGSQDVTATTIAGERLVTWTRLEVSDCFNFLSSSGGSVRTVRATSCGRAHDAQVVAVERGKSVWEVATAAFLSGASEGLFGVTTSSAAETVPGAAGATTTTSEPDEDLSSEALLQTAMDERCEATSAPNVVDDVPSGIVISSVYSERLLAPSPDGPDPLLLCLLRADEDDEALTRSFTR